MATTIFTPNPTTPATSLGVGNGWSFRTNCTITGAAIGQVRVTITGGAGGEGNLVVNNCWIAICAAGTAATSAFSQLLFTTAGGGAGFTAGTGVSTVSDWLNFTCSSSDNLMVSLEVSAGSSPLKAVGNSNSTGYFQNATGLYNNTSGSGYSANSGDDYAVALIETQAGAAPITLMGAISL